MTPEQFKKIRQDLGLTQWELAALLGFKGSKRNNARRIRAFESGQEQFKLPIQYSMMYFIGKPNFVYKRLERLENEYND